MSAITNSAHEEFLYLAAQLRKHMKAFKLAPTDRRAAKWIDHYGSRLDRLIYLDKEAIRRYATLLDAQKRMELCNAEGESHSVMASIAQTPANSDDVL